MESNISSQLLPIYLMPPILFWYVFKKFSKEFTGACKVVEMKKQKLQKNASDKEKCITKVNFMWNNS